MTTKKDIRFEFGANWQHFLNSLNEARIKIAENSLKEMLGRENLAGMSFLDVGSGSGLFSLAARNLGANVHSFDFDPNSVDCARMLRSQFQPDVSAWIIEQGSALDEYYLTSLGKFDIVYSWGVLHHTGNMWQGLELVSKNVKDGGSLFISIYNDQGLTSLHWAKIKRLYSNSPKWRQILIEWIAFLRLWGPQLTRDVLRGRGLSTWRRYGEGTNRGMSAWHDLVDWVGGYPFEVAKPEEIFDFYKKCGFTLQKLKTCGGGLGCNEFVFVKAET